ncbi:phosphatase PAP2 family protein [Candidatus Woesearchaeota archaeon]|nr:MAG: phosphatase PAP2 family protein [Candidatus Woesearchaeota archaeon]
MRRVNTYAIASGACFALFFLASALRGVLSGVDAWLARLVEGGAGGSMLTVWRFLSLPGDPYLLLAATILVLWWGVLGRKQWEVYSLVALISGGLVLAALSKVVVNSPRPDSSVLFFSGPGYPSAHVTLAVVFWGWFFLTFSQSAERKRLLFASLVAVVCGVALSRVVLLAHFGSDVLGGVLLGLFWLFAVAAAKESLVAKSAPPR